MNKQLKKNTTKKQAGNSTTRIAERDELNFSDDEPTPSFIDLQPETENELDENTRGTARKSSRGTAMPGDDPTDDDLAPEILIKEDGARSSHELGKGKAMDQRLRVVNEDEIGGGNGLDEAELAHVKPLDGKPTNRTLK